MFLCTLYCNLITIAIYTQVMGLAQGPPDSPTGLAAFLGRAMDAPHSLSIRNAVELLKDIGALDSVEDLTGACHQHVYKSILGDLCLCFSRQNPATRVLRVV